MLIYFGRFYLTGPGGSGSGKVGSCWHIVMLLVLMGCEEQKLTEMILFFVKKQTIIFDLQGLVGYLSTNMDHKQSFLFSLSVGKKQMVRSKLTRTCTMTLFLNIIVRRWGPTQSNFQWSSTESALFTTKWGIPNSDPFKRLKLQAGGRSRWWRSVATNAIPTPQVILGPGSMGCDLGSCPLRCVTFCFSQVWFILKQTFHGTRRAANQQKSTFLWNKSFVVFSDLFFAFAGQPRTSWMSTGSVHVWGGLMDAIDGCFSMVTCIYYMDGKGSEFFWAWCLGDLPGDRWGIRSDTKCVNNSYGWWFRNPVDNHLGFIKPCKFWDKLPTSTGDLRISEPSTVTCYNVFYLCEVL